MSDAQTWSMISGFFTLMVACTVLMLRTTRSDIAALAGTVRGDIAALRGEVRSDIAQLRGEVRGEMGELRGELRSLGTKVDDLDRDVQRLMGRAAE